MYDMQKELNEFYNDHVRLKDERKKLAEHRDANLVRLQDGLKELEYPSNFDSKDQGSYAMGTINKHPDKRYDIDEAIIFEKDDLPLEPADARKRIEEAMVKAGGNFSVPPKAKTNCVRISYEDGYYVDFAIYRKNVNAFGSSIIEHAGAEWLTRDPVAITNWFIDSIKVKSPSKAYGAIVENDQLRRIVRWLKMFAKSRESWNLPGGLIISTLAEERYVANANRDDASLYDTMVSMRDRLKNNKEICNPVDKSLSLTSRNKDKTRVKNLEEKLDFAINKLNPLFSLSCNRLEALQAWNWVFDHPYWVDEIEKEASKESNVKKNVSTIIVTPPKQHSNV
jgi:hypothetical protein